MDKNSRVVLTDERIKQVARDAVAARLLSWTGFEEDERGFYTVPILSPCHYQFAHAIEREVLAQSRAAQPESATQHGCSNDKCEGGFVYDTNHTRRMPCGDCATGTTGASIDTPEFRELLYCLDHTLRRAWASRADDLIAHIDAIIGDLRAQLAAKGQGEPVAEVTDGYMGPYRAAKVFRKADVRTGDKLYLSAPASAQPDRGAAQGDRWQVVPKVPTKEMIDNIAAFVDGHENDAEVIYRAMLAAAPSPASQPESATSTVGEVRSVYVKPWQERESQYETQEFSQIERMEAEIFDLRAKLAARGQDDALDRELLALAKNCDERLASLAAPASAQPDRGAAQVADAPQYENVMDHNGRIIGVRMTNADKMPSYAAASPASQPVASEAHTQEEAAPSDIALELLHYPSDDGHILVRLDEVQEVLARRAAVAPSDAKGKADAANAGDRYGRAKFEESLQAEHGGALTREDLDACWSEAPGYSWRLAHGLRSDQAQSPATRAADANVAGETAGGRLGEPIHSDHELEAAIDRVFPIPDNPHASVRQRNLDAREAFRRGWAEARRQPPAPASRSGDAGGEACEQIWDCKIGGMVGPLPPGADAPMRKAVADTFRRLTGTDAEFCFSNWGAELNELERAVVEKRAPRPQAQPDPSFNSEADLIAWLDGLHEMTSSGAITNRKWIPAQRAIEALRAASHAPDATLAATSAADAKDAEVGFYKRLSQQAQKEAMRESVRDAIAKELDGLYTCGRVWSAWSYGTMSQDDFAPAGEDDDVVDNITDAAIAAMAAAPSSGEPNVKAFAADESELATLTAEIDRLERKLKNTPLRYSSYRFDIAMEIDKLKARRDKAAAPSSAAGKEGGSK